MRSERNEAAGWSRPIGVAIAGLLIALGALIVVGALVPSLPIAGAIGTLIATILPGFVWLTLLIASLVVWTCAAGRTRKALLTLASLSSVGLLVPIWGIAQVARDNHVPLRFANLFGMPGNMATSPPDQVFTYARDQGDDLTARVFRPVGAPPADGWPILVYIHGGGWTAGSNTDRSPDWRWFANHGWLTVSIGYSLSSPKRHLWNRVIGQLGCALVWTQANARRMQGDPRRLALVGESAGGNLVLNLGYQAAAGEAPSICGGNVPIPTTVIADYPGVDLAAIHANSAPLIGGIVREMVTSYTGGSPSEVPWRYAKVASSTHVRRGSPRTLMFITESDKVVPPDSMRAFAARARRMGADMRVLDIPYGMHVFDAGGVGNAIFRETSLRFLEEK